MASIELPQGSYDAAELIAAIQQSNDQQNQAIIDGLNNTISSLNATLADRDAAINSLNSRIDELEVIAAGSTEGGNLLQAVLTRLAAVEASLPITRTGFGVTTTVEDGVTTYRVQMLDQNGSTQIVTFDLPSS